MKPTRLTAVLRLNLFSPPACSLLPLCVLGWDDHWQIATWLGHRGYYFESVLDRLPIFLPNRMREVSWPKSISARRLTITLPNSHVQEIHSRGVYFLGLGPVSRYLQMPLLSDCCDAERSVDVNGKTAREGRFTAGLCKARVELMFTFSAASSVFTSDGVGLLHVDSGSRIILQSPPDT